MRTILRPNIVLITIDSCRQDIISIYNVKEKHVGKNISKYGKQGLIFINAFSPAPYTSASIYSLITSLYLNKIPPYYKPYSLSTMDVFISLPSILRRGGYITIGLSGSNPFLSSSTNYHKMFNVFKDYINDPRIRSSTFSRIVDKVLNKLKLDESKKSFIKTYILNIKPPIIDAINLTNDAINFIIKYKSKMFFLWIHYMDAHVPHIPPIGGWQRKIKYALKRIKAFNKELTENQSLIGILKHFYKEQLVFIDHNIGRLFTFLEK